MPNVAATASPVRRATAWTIPPVAVVLLFALALAAINPIGFIGGDSDEVHYLRAARCWAERGWCVPPDHWWRRWPIVTPAALIIRLFGETEWSIAIAPLAYALAALATLVAMVERQFGRTEAIVAGLVLAATPMFSAMVLELNIDVPELAFTLGALFCLQRLGEPRPRGWALACGLLLGLAIQARPTSLALLPIVLGLVAWRRRDWIVPVCAGALLPSLVEAMVYAVAERDPLLPWRLSLAHTRVPSTELLPGVDMTQSPLFNPVFIAGWRRAMDIHVHWTVDGLINFLVHPAGAATLLGALALVALEWRRLGSARAGGPVLIFLLALAALWFGALTYGFAVDPKPRMFLLILAIAAIVFAVLARARWPLGRELVIAAFALIVVKGVVVTYERIALHEQRALAPSWVAAEGGAMAVEPRTARFLELVPEVRRLPLHAPGTQPARLLLIGEGDCATSAAKAHLPGWRTVRSHAAPRAEPAPIPWLRERRLLFSPAVTPVMCVLAPA